MVVVRGNGPATKQIETRRDGEEEGSRPLSSSLGTQKGGRKERISQKREERASL